MKIFCIGRNYAEHAKELNTPLPEEPVVFMKPATALLNNGGAFVIPGFSSDIHYEGELVLRFARAGKNIRAEVADSYIDAVTVGIDFTARDIQNRSKDKGLPWETAKAFDGSAAVGEFIPVIELKGFPCIRFELWRNGAPVQKGSAASLIFGFSRMISFISRFFTIEKGDLLFTGTPAGVGTVKKGETYEGYAEGKKLLSIKIT